MNTKILLMPAVAAALWSCASLGGGRSLSRGPELAAAEGEVSFTRVPGSGTAVDLRVKHLREPERLEPPAYAYVAWAQARGDEPPVNLGLLNVAPDLSGELRVLTATACAGLFVTAEASGDAERPTGRRLLWAACD
ncbi:MAG: hypothetical protein HYV14_02040 [Elusimicrobia bacterium]|nr:hypothetical protein [Elusimicrobiota bacterium]